MVGWKVTSVSLVTSDSRNVIRSGYVKSRHRFATVMLLPGSSLRFGGTYVAEGFGILSYFESDCQMQCKHMAEFVGWQSSAFFILSDAMCSYMIAGNNAKSIRSTKDSVYAKSHLSSYSDTMV